MASGRDKRPICKGVYMYTVAGAMARGNMMDTQEVTQVQRGKCRVSLTTDKAMLFTLDTPYEYILKRKNGTYDDRRTTYLVYRKGVLYASDKFGYAVDGVKLNMTDEPIVAYIMHLGYTIVV